MDTVNFNCNHCGKLMAVSKDHVGMQVQCPHCQGVVQAPAPTPAAVTTPESPLPPENKPAEPPESIFAPAPEGSDIFGQSSKPRLEMPVAPLQKVPYPIEDEDTALLDQNVKEPADVWLDSPKKDQAVRKPESWLESPKTAPAHEKHDLPEEIAPPRYRAKSSLLGPMVLIFLVPYALVTTGYIAWTIYNRPKIYDPLERLPDPKPDPKQKDGGAPERVKHNSKLPDHLKTVLNKPIEIGDIEVTPIKVQFQNNDLMLRLKVRNLSREYRFIPLPDFFVNMNYHKANKPYTYLDPGVEKLCCYGGYVEFKGKDPQGYLRPGEEMITDLTTDLKDRDKTVEMVKSNQPLVWRVQVRRGMVKTSQGMQSATAVIGVEFTSAAIEKEGDPAKKGGNG